MIDTLAKLKSRLAYLANRDDMFDSVSFSPATIDGEITVAIENSTRTISRDLAKRGGLGLQEVLDDTLVTVSGTETVTLPTGFAGSKAFIRTSNPNVVLQPRDFVSLVNDFASPTPGAPLVYSIVSGATPKVYLRPIPDSAYTLRLVYWKALVTLTDSVTNPLFDAHPDIYEAAGMVEIALSVEDEAGATRWRVVYEQKMNDLSQSDRNSQWAAAMSGAMPQVQITIA
jgi:hypothetical protein